MRISVLSLLLSLVVVGQPLIAAQPASAPAPSRMCMRAEVVGVAALRLDAARMARSSISLHGALQRLDPVPAAGFDGRTLCFQLASNATGACDEAQLFN
jgi:hypothetical protein